MLRALRVQASSWWDPTTVRYLVLTAVVMGVALFGPFRAEEREARSQGYS